MIYQFYLFLLKLRIIQKKMTNLLLLCFVFALTKCFNQAFIDSNSDAINQTKIAYLEFNSSKATGKLFCF